jgi:hypothetical protein
VRGREHEHEYEHEHEHKHGNVRARMAEVIAGMSDEEIAEILRKGGYISPAASQGAEPIRQAQGDAAASDGKQEPKPKPKAAFVEAWAPERAWWTEEDEAAYLAEEEAERRGRPPSHEATARPERTEDGKTETSASTLLRQGFHLRQGYGGQDGGQASMSTSTITNTKDGQPVAAPGKTSNAERASGSNVPPEGGTTNGRQAEA